MSNKQGLEYALTYLKMWKLPATTATSICVEGSEVVDFKSAFDVNAAIISETKSVSNMARLDMGYLAPVKYTGDAAPAFKTVTLERRDSLASLAGVAAPVDVGAHKGALPAGTTMGWDSKGRQFFTKGGKCFALIDRVYCF